jgi:hypothetical protein
MREHPQRRDSGSADQLAKEGPQRLGTHSQQARSKGNWRCAAFRPRKQQEMIIFFQSLLRYWLCHVVIVRLWQDVWALSQFLGDLGFLMYFVPFGL